MFDLFLKSHWAIEPIHHPGLDIDLTERPVRHDFSTPEWAAIIAMIFGIGFVGIALFIVDFNDTLLVVFAALFGLVALAVIYLGWAALAFKRAVIFDDTHVRFIGKGPWGDHTWEAPYHTFEGLVMRKEIVVRRSSMLSSSEHDTSTTREHTYYVIALRHRDSMKTVPLYVEETDDPPHSRWVKTANALGVNAVMEDNGARLERTHLELATPIAQRANPQVRASSIPQITPLRSRYDKTGLFRTKERSHKTTKQKSGVFGAVFRRDLILPPAPAGIGFERAENGAVTVLLPGQWDMGNFISVLVFFLISGAAGLKFGSSSSGFNIFMAVPLLFAIVPTYTLLRRRLSTRRITISRDSLIWRSVWLSKPAAFAFSEISDVALYNEKLMIASAERQALVGEGLDPDILNYMRDLIIAACEASAEQNAR